MRKHRTALIALAVYHFVFFFPTLFMQRLPSPNDVFFNYDPWAHTHRLDVQNSLMNDPPTSYYTLMSLMKHDWSAFHWNPFVASGIPGFGSSASAVLSPFVLVPTFALPLGWVYVGIILLKLNVAFWFSYLWLREERLGKKGAAIGAIVIAASGAYAVRWWWQATNATALYPALLWIVGRVTRGKRVPFWAVVLIAFSYSIAGFPAAMLYGVYLSVAYGVYLLVRKRFAGRIAPSASLRAGSAPLIAVLAGVMIAAPMIVPFVQFVRRSGYLATRANSSAQAFPLRHAALLIDPDRLGNNAYHTWSGDPALGVFNNYVEATVYLGIIPLLLVIFALANRRARSRWFWLAATAVFAATMFGFHPLGAAIARLPLLQYSPMTRLQLVLPIGIGYLAAAGSAAISRRRHLVAATIGALAAAELAIFTGRFYPFVPFQSTVPPATPMVSFLQKQERPFRIAPMMNYLWPNTSELYELEDIRSHFSSEADYRRLLQRVDPTSVSDLQTVITLNSLKFNFGDPLIGMLGVRYFIEHKEIDIVKWTIFANSKPAFPSTGNMMLQPGMVMQRHVTIGSSPYYAIEIPVTVRATFTTSPKLIVTLKKDAATLFQRAFTPADIGVMNKIYIPVYGHLRPGDTAVLRMESAGIRADLLRTAGGVAGDSPLFYDRVEVPLIFDRELPDGRVFVNAGEVPRFHSVRRVSRMPRGDFLARATSVDFRDEAIVTDSAPGAIDTSDASVTLRRYANNEQAVDVDAPAGTFLASSEKLTPELRVTIDGRAVKPVEINMLFAGVRVPAGQHVVVFSRRIGRGWWWVSAMGLVLALGLSITDVVRRR